MQVRAVCQFDVKGYKEPTLDELLGDAGVRLLMARDRVDEGSLRRLADEIRARLKAGRAGARAASPGRG
jgi:hypothetical protein